MTATYDDLHGSHDLYVDITTSLLELLYVEQFHPHGKSDSAIGQLLPLLRIGSTPATAPPPQTMKSSFQASRSYTLEVTCTINMRHRLSILSPTNSNDMRARQEI